jgi:hypothetical protein
MYERTKEVFDKIDKDLWKKIIALCTDGEAANSGEDNGFSHYFLKDFLYR